MKSSTAILKIRDRLNKRDSQLGKNIKNEAIQESVNKAVIELARIFIKGNTQNKDSIEEVTSRVLDLQVLLKEEPLSFINKGLFVESEKLPLDFFHPIVLEVYGKKGECSYKVDSDLREEINSNKLLDDYTSQPSIDFNQSFHTIFSNRIRQYHNKDFDVTSLKLKYYRLPKFIIFPNTYQLDKSKGKDVTWEFKEDFCEIIIDAAVAIIAGDINDINAFQLAKQRVEQNN